MVRGGESEHPLSTPSDQYWIVGGDGREYGPVSVDTLAQWIAQKRADAETRVRWAEDAPWQRLGALPELAALLPAPPPAGRPVPGGPAPVALPTEAELLARDYRLRTLDFLGDGWRLFTRQFGPLLGASAIVTGGYLLLSVWGLLPFVGLLAAPASIIVSGPLLGGVWQVFVRAWRGDAVRPGEVFDGFRREFASLLILYVLVTLAAVVAILPGLVPVIIGVIHAAQGGEPSLLGPALIGIGVVVMLALGLLIWTLWGYAFVLVMDRGLAFWPALELSRRVVSRHLFRNLVFFFATGVLACVGYLFCLVGVFFTVPWTMGAYARAYEELFGPRS